MLRYPEAERRAGMYHIVGRFLHLKATVPYHTKHFSAWPQNVREFGYRFYLSKVLFWNRAEEVPDDEEPHSHSLGRLIQARLKRIVPVDVIPCTIRVLSLKDLPLTAKVDPSAKARVW